PSGHGGPGGLSQAARTTGGRLYVVCVGCGGDSLLGYRRWFGASGGGPPAGREDAVGGRDRPRGVSGWAGRDGDGSGGGSGETCRVSCAHDVRVATAAIRGCVGSGFWMVGGWDGHLACG